MARVTEPEVRDIIPSVSASLDLTPFITAASLNIDKVAASDCGSELTDAELKEAERWLAAHYTAVSSPDLAVQSEQFEGERNVYSRGRRNNDGVKSTQYGVMANTLTCGCLVEIDMRVPTLIASGGAHYDE